MKVYLVILGAYEGSDVVGVWSTKELAVSHAAREAPTHSEALGGAIGYGVSVVAYNMDSEGYGEGVEWKPWTTRDGGSRIVAVEPLDQILAELRKMGEDASQTSGARSAADDTARSHHSSVEFSSGMPQ